ncbi:MAG: MMPL family transporter [Actinomycetota bacterium]
MTALARFVTGSAGRILLATTAIVVVGAVWAGGVTERLTTGGNEVPGSESVRAAEIVADRFGVGSPNLVVLVGGGDVDSPAQAGVGIAVQLLLASEGIDVLSSYWVTGDEALASESRREGLVVAHLPGDDQAVQLRSAELAPQLRELATDEATVEVGGTGPARAELIEQTEEDLLRAELVAIPITLLVLLIVFRTVVAALLPFVVAIVAVVGTLIALRVLVAFMTVSVFAQNVMTALGLAMAIDFTLFLVARYREVRPGSTTATAGVAAAVIGAGPSILFSGLTTAASLAGLLAFDTPMLRSFAYAGVAVVLVAIVGALVVLPAVMTLLGDRIDRWSVRDVSGGRPTRQGRWYRLAHVLMRRPGVVSGTTLIALLVIASPFARIDFGLNDDRVLPTSSEARSVLDTVRDDFQGLESGAITVVPDDPASHGNEVASHAGEIQVLPGVARVVDRGGWLQVIPSVEPISAEGRALVEEIRGLDAPVPLLVGGEAARLVDNTDHVTDRLPFVLAGMILATAGLLGLLFRSVLVPVKAVLLNLLSLSAMFGAVVWIFQDGRFAAALGYTPTGLTDVTVPMLMFCVAFGLSMDYEVFLLSRIREEYVRTGDPTESVAIGLQRTGGVLSASAVLMAVVFTSFATGSVTHLKVLGIGITLAVLLDAFVIRTLLVPAVMKLAGHANWWPSARPTLRAVEGESDEAMDVGRADVDDGGRGGDARDPVRVLLPRRDP